MNWKQLFVLLLAVAGLAAKLSAQGTAFMYQGRLNDNGSAATGAYDLRFALYDAATNGNAISFPQTNFASGVTSGLFNATLDFGPVFSGTNYWLSIGVRTNGSTNAFTLLWPRQPVLPVPYAIFANSASNLLGTLPANRLTGTLPASAFAGYTNTVALTNTGNLFNGSFNGVFSGNGTNLLNLNASQLTGGTVADARLTPNVALLDHNQTFTGANSFTSINAFTNRGNYFVGSFFGNGLVGWIPVGGTYTQAMVDAGYLLTNPGLTTVLLPPAAQLTVGDIVRVSGAGAGGWLVAENSGQSILGNFASYHKSFLLPASATPGHWRCLACSSDGSLMYAGGNIGSGGVYSSSDSGHTWSQTTVVGTSWYAIACSADGTKVFAATHGGSIQMSSNGGVTWSAIASSSAAWTSIACTADGSKFIASVGGGSLYLWTGTTPSVTGPGIANWSAVATSSDGTYLAAAINGGTIYTSSTGGGSWGSTGSAANWSALVASANGLKLAAAASGGGIATSTNFGANWTTTSAPAAAWSCLAGSSDCTRLVAGASNGLIYASANFGATWSSIGTTNQAWSAICASADGGIFAAAVNAIAGGIFYSGADAQPNVISTNSTICGSQGSAVELQYIGNGQFMPVSSAGLLWAN